MHFHAFAYTGRGYTDREVRSGVAPASFPPLVIGMAGRSPVARLDTMDAAIGWLEHELTQHVPVDADAFPVKVRLEYSRAQLQQTTADTVTYGYWSRSRLYVSRQLFPCDCRV